MSNIDKQALRKAAEKATKGEWWSDVVETDGEYGDGEDRVSGYHSYAVYVGHESLLDMTNSTAACIHTEWDHDYQMAWDEMAKRNAEFIAAANPATVLALLDELEARKVIIPSVSDDAFWLCHNGRFVFREETYRSAVFKALDLVGIKSAAGTAKGE